MHTSKFAASALLVLATVGAGSAFAEGFNDRNYPQLPTSASTKTRAEVQAEVLQARKDGTLFVGNDDNYPVLPQTQSTKTRADVRAEYVAALKAGLIVRERS